VPLFIVIGRDGEGVGEKRAAAREAHLANMRPISDAGRARFAGPLRDESGQACGSVLVLEFPSLAEARTFAESDPYVAEGVFASLEVFETIQVFPEG
jgi:hypothetical protein